MSKRGELITGQLILWDKGPHEVEGSGRHIVQVFGCIAMPKLTADRYCAEAVKLCFRGGDHNELLTLSAVRGTTEPLPEHYATRGYSIDQIMTAPVWRS